MRSSSLGRRASPNWRSSSERTASSPSCSTPSTSRFRTPMCSSSVSRTERDTANHASAVVTRRRLLTLGAAFALRVATPAASHTGSTVTLGQVSLTFYAVAAAVVHEILERLGHAVVVRKGSHEQMFPLFGAGAVDIMAAVWLPEGHAAYWSRYGT